MLDLSYPRRESKKEQVCVCAGGQPSILKLTRPCRSTTRPENKEKKGKPKRLLSAVLCCHEGSEAGLPSTPGARAGRETRLESAGAAGAGSEGPATMPSWTWSSWCLWKAPQSPGWVGDEEDTHSQCTRGESSGWERLEKTTWPAPVEGSPHLHRATPVHCGFRP